MKSILAVALIAGFVAAEVPSHSYLPPPPRGYSSGPAVVTARALTTHQPGDHSPDHIINGFARSSPASHDHIAPSPQARYNEEPGYDQNAAGYTRNALEDANATVVYDAEERSYKPQVSYEDTSEVRSTPGYDINANNFRSSSYQGEQNGATSARPGYN